MSNLNAPKGKFHTFIMGKGFYLALAVCLVGAGTAAWISVDRTIGSLQSSPLADTPPAQTQETQQAEQKVNDIAKAPRQDIPNAQEQPSSSQSDAPAPQQSPAASSLDSALSEEPSSSQASSSPSGQPSEPVVQSAPQAPQQSSPASSFALPINADILAPFSGDTLVKNITLGDWRTHNGVDIKAPQGAKVTASCDGTVTSVSSHPLWGNVVEVTSGDLVMTYAGLADVIPVKVNDTVSAGDPLGQVGTIPCELSMESHLHFDVRQNGSYVDPVALVQE